MIHQRCGMHATNTEDFLLERASDAVAFEASCAAGPLGQSKAGSAARNEIISRWAIGSASAHFAQQALADAPQSRALGGGDCNTDNRNVVNLF
jgi:hypothetical protein